MVFNTIKAFRCTWRSGTGAIEYGTGNAAYRT